MKFTHFDNKFKNYGAISVSDYQWLRGVPRFHCFLNENTIIVHHDKCIGFDELQCNVSLSEIRRGFSFCFEI